MTNDSEALPALSAPAPRRRLHTRQIECQGFERDDGLYDIEAHMSDVKSYAFTNRYRGDVSAGEPVHDMWLRLTVDERLQIHAAEACTTASPYRVCPEAAARYQQLVGARIGPGWRRTVKQLFAGVDGCTHLTELLGPLATTAFQTVFTRSKSRRPVDDSRPPPLLNSCHAFASDGEVVKVEWPQHYTGVAPDTDTPA